VEGEGRESVLLCSPRPEGNWIVGLATALVGEAAEVTAARSLAGGDLMASSG
jgi:hypothetical protein